MDQAGGYAGQGISGHAGYRRTAPPKGKKYIAPEDRDLIIHEMRIDCVPEQSRKCSAFQASIKEELVW